ncbi:MULTISPECIES: hypothetical protein [unclassified Pseudoalteromonas]|uniref:hypothetical protein n=1 Tax=unclassified Pseudoalteromonas TaxID=194690 RepID=UPI0003F7F2B3|nr:MULTISPECIES: hypothetical protein [unclassified Pseudoalteromonas]
MKLHPKAKAALGYYNAHRKARDIAKCDFQKAVNALCDLNAYAPQIAKRAAALGRFSSNSWYAYSMAEFDIQLDNDVRLLDAYHNIDPVSPDEPDLTEFLNDIPF